MKFLAIKLIYEIYKNNFQEKIHYIITVPNLLVFLDAFLNTKCISSAYIFFWLKGNWKEIKNKEYSRFCLIQETHCDDKENGN